MASFDIKSLFTSIPLKETIEICVRELFRDVEELLGLNRVEFHKLLSLAAGDCLFVFDGKTYKQHDGVLMGSPISPSLANAFLCYWERIWLSECPDNIKPS